MGLKILVVDDDVDILEWLKIELKKFDREVELFTTESGNEAINVFMSHKIDFVLSDISMEGMNGFQLYKHIRQLDDSVPVVMMTAFGYDPNHTVVNAVKKGLKDILYKPFDIEDLFELIKKRI